MRTRETDDIIGHPDYLAWQRQCRMAETSLGLEEWSERRHQEGPSDPPGFTLDEQGLRDHFRRFGRDDMPILSGEEPASSIDAIFEEHCFPFVRGGTIYVYPLRFPSDPDGLLVVIDGTPRRCGSGGDWDDYASVDWLDRYLTVNEVVQIANSIIAEANRVVALS